MDIQVYKKSFSDPLYLKKFLFKSAILFLIIGGLVWLFYGIFETNLVKDIFGKGILSKTIYILVGLSALGIMFDRDTYLPFLGPTIAPCAALQNRVPAGATRDVKVSVTPNAKVFYWASEPATQGLDKVNSWKEAYGKYDNVGIATADANGVAILKVREPQMYAVPWMGVLRPHVHYRICEPNGFMTSVNTAYIDNKVEGFECNALPVGPLNKKYTYM
jgi:uncharacterized membrane protein YuzA (DUF378 family)